MSSYLYPEEENIENGHEDHSKGTILNGKIKNLNDWYEMPRP